MATRTFALMLFAARALAQTVEGSVFDASTGNGIAGVKVELLRGTTPFYETATDGGGRFHFANIPENDYAIRYQSAGHWSTAGPTDYRPFRVAAGSPVKLEARLMPWSRISGRVVDSAGKGVGNARLELSGLGVVANGRRYLRTSWGGGGGAQLSDAPVALPMMGHTDEQGKFEVQLMPGDYTLSVIPPLDLKPPGPASAWVRTYYPGAASAEGALKIVVLPGGEVTDVEVKLLAIPTHAVRGMVLNPDGKPAGGVLITQGEPGQSTSVKSNADGMFEFPNVPEAETRFLAERQEGSVKLRAAEWIDVPRHDLEDVKLRLTKPLTLRGKMVMKGSKEGRAPGAATLLLALRGGRVRENDLGAQGGALLGAIIIPDAKGNFLVQDAYPGLYWLPAPFQPPPQPYYLAAVRVGDTDLMTQDVEISSDAAISVVYETDGGGVSGKAENCAMGGVLLVPSDPLLHRRGFSASGPCDANDHYQVQAVRPGEYYAMAFAGNGPVLPVDETLLKLAVKVTVRAGTASTTDVQAITRPIF
jgi:hypothetical protein